MQIASNGWNVILFCGKNKKNIISLLPAEFAQRVLKVKKMFVLIVDTLFEWNYRFHSEIFLFTLASWKETANKLQSTLIVSTLLISNNHLFQIKNLGPVVQN